MPPTDTKMESCIRKSDAVCQTMSSMQEDHGWIGSHSTASTPHHLDQTPTGTYTTEDWIRKLPREFLDINEGSLKDVMLVIRRCFEEAELLPANHQEAAMREQGERFKLWMDGEDDLDLRLVRAPTVREEFVSNLTTLVLFLSTGIKLYRPEHQQTLSEDISRVVDQFSADAFSQLKQSLNCSPVNVLEFLDITKTKIKPTIDNLYELLPTTRHLLEDFDESEPQRGEEIEFDRDRPSNSERCLLKVHQRIGRPHAFLTPASATSSTSHGAKNSRGRHANPSKSSTKQSSGSTDSPSIPSLFSDNGIHGSVHPPTNTITSTSPSEVGNTNSEPTNSDSIGSPLSCKKYRPFLKLSQRIKRPRAFFTPASASSSTEHGVNNSRRPHINPSKSRTKQSSGSTDSPSISSLFSNNDIHNCVHPSITTITSFSTSKVENSEPGQLVRVDPDQLVRVWSRNGRNYKTCIVLIDTGADENFIRRSVVRELDIVIQKSPILLGLETLGSHKFKVGEYVRPTWQFEDERKQHQNDSFSILTEMPDDIDMVLGRLASQDLDIQLFKPRRALVAYEDWQGLSTQEREKQQLERQTRDGDASRAKMRQELAARRAHLRRKRDAENAPKKMKPEDSTSKKDATGSADDHV